MSHPLEFIPESCRKKLFLSLLTLTLGLFGVLMFFDAPLRNPVSPCGIVSFEFAETPEMANAIVDEWNSRARLFAAFSLGFDYLFMVVYGLALSLGVLMAASKHGGEFEKVGAYLGWSALLAVLFDVFENIFLWRILTGVASSFCPRMATFSATVKFLLIVISAGFALIVGLRKK